MKLFIVVMLLLLPLLVAAEPDKQRAGLFRINRFDKEGQFHGKWKVYINNGTILVRQGRFRHGKEVGKWRYYYQDGQRLMEEKYKPRKNYIQVKRYHENGQLAKEGQARMIESGNILRYFWFGEWKVYDKSGQFSHTEYYEQGNLVKR
ncbi:toxin-antitoxin system YwqK family antitoxin [Pontibacter ruber]|uniref:Toxin-antitoxin system YwqK family antitoxin n=1 Tax=Pontibacter ruber TaxID=1343895 RepID=A0ABW5CSC9_9BACT|nr:hypothetical protein [Pontibacter ruber]